MKKEFFVSYSEKSRGGEPINPSDPWSEHTLLITEFEIESVTLTKPEHPYYEDIIADIPDGVKDVFVVYIRYGTGSTFGMETGRGQILNICLTQDEAEAIIATIEDGSHSESYMWRGYFETLESCHAEKFPVKLK